MHTILNLKSEVKEWISTRGLYHFYQTHSTTIMMKSLEGEQRGLFGLQPRQMDHNTRLGQQHGLQDHTGQTHIYNTHVQHTDCREMANHTSLSAKVSDPLRKKKTCLVCMCVSLRGVVLPYIFDVIVLH